jgi:hypothetical protein
MYCDVAGAVRTGPPLAGAGGCISGGAALASGGAGDDISGWYVLR